LSTFLRNLRPLADSSQEYGVTIALEVYGDLMSTGRMAADVIGTIDHPAVRMIYDTANCKTYGGIWAHENDDLPCAIPLLANLHLKDELGGEEDLHFPPIGEGNVDFAGVLSTLEWGDYRGPLSIEIEYDNGVWPDRDVIDSGVSPSVAHIRTLLTAAGASAHGE